MTPTIISNTEVLLLCMLFISVLFAFNIPNWKPKIFNRLSALYLLAFFGCIFEIGAFWADGNVQLVWLNYLSNILYMGSISLISIVFLMYGCEKFPKTIWRNKTQFRLMLIPAIINLLSLVTVPFYKLIFYVAQDGTYHRAGFFWIQLIPYGYMLITAAGGIYWFMKSETTMERNMYSAIALFTVPPLVLGGFQVMMPANMVDTMEFSITLSLMMEFALTQNNKITRDPLTKLANRVVLDNVLFEKMNNRKRDDNTMLYVMMGDLDGFKGINDTLGHLEGDRALKITADILYNISVAHQATATRFGGDEFVIILESEYPNEPDLIVKEIEEELAKASMNEPFDLRMSMGTTSYRNGDSIPDILKAADRELYRVKNRRKQKGQ